MKYFVTDIENIDNITVFEEFGFDFTESEEGIWYTEEKAMFDWWNELAQAIEFLNDNEINAETNELAD
ncbi:hypothetical protein AWT95_03025, partial [Streptococcus pyogenes]